MTGDSQIVASNSGHRYWHAVLRNRHGVAHVFPLFCWVSVNPFCRTDIPSPIINMRKPKDALRFKFEGQLSH
jgi:hypothetical protein